MTAARQGAPPPHPGEGRQRRERRERAGRGDAVGGMGLKSCPIKVR